jgi:hypothetical protein
MKIRELLQPWPLSGKLEDVRQWSNERYESTSVTIRDEEQIYTKDFLWDQNSSVYKTNCMKVLKAHIGEFVSAIGDLEVEPAIQIKD